MTFGQKLVSRYLPPLILILVTLSVFAILQNKGPRGTVRQFYSAAQSGDRDMLYSLMAEAYPEQNEAVGALLDQTHRLVEGDFTPYNMIVEEKQKYIVVIVNYVSSRRQTNVPIAYVLVRRDGRCKITASGSIQLQNSL